MDKFIKMNYIVLPDGTDVTIEDHKKKYYPGAKYLEVYKNSTYMVIKSAWSAKGEGCDLIWLSIKRNSREIIHDWRDLQEIKNELVGAECEGLELYPAEGRRVDTANQYHLWVFDDPKFRLPFGFSERFIGGDIMAKEVGAKQRPIDEIKSSVKLKPKNRERLFKEFVCSSLEGTTYDDLWNKVVDYMAEHLTNEELLLWYKEIKGRYGRKK